MELLYCSTNNKTFPKNFMAGIKFRHRDIMLAVHTFQ